jgi:hypothetical protein
MARPIVYGPAGSTYVWSTRLALAEKGVAHDLVDVPVGTHREEPHLSRHPFGKVPSSMTGLPCMRRRRSCAISMKASRSRHCSRPICTNSRG